MASSVQLLIDSYYDGLQYADPRTKDWLLLWSDYSYVLAATMLYLLAVWIGPKIMKERQPFDLWWFIVPYNLGLVGLSLYMFIEIILSTRAAGYEIMQPYNVNVTPYNPAELRVAKVLWWYFFSKVIEFMDTILMVLRKKDRQITFLHVFHHASMLNIWWFVMMYIPGGLSYFGAMLNCFIHVVMYAYYGLSVLPELQPYLWWKKYITKLQLLQFVITFSHSLYSIICGADFPSWGKYLLVGYMVSMLILFGNFYVQTYKRNKHQRQSSRPSPSKTSLGNNNHFISNGVHNGHCNKVNGVTNGKINGYSHERKAD